MEKKIIMDALVRSSVRDIVADVNKYNETSTSPITKDDVVDIFHVNGSYILLFFK